MTFYRKKKPGPRSKATKARRSLMLECDRLVREQVFARDGFKCVRCGGDKHLHAAHVLPKGSHPRMRFMPINVLTMCLHDHIFWCHKDPLAFTEWFKQKYPERYIELLIWDRQAPKIDLKQLKIELGAGHP